MPLGKNAQKFKLILEQENSASTKQLNIMELRSFTDEIFGAWVQQATTPDNISVEIGFIEIDDLTAKYRIYSDTSLTAPSATVIYHPAGGYAVDMQNQQDTICALFAKHSGAKVISIQPPLAPEHKHPEIIDVAYHVTKYFYNNHAKFAINQDSFYMSGYSMGGNAAVLISLKAASEKSMEIAGNIIVSGQMDFSLATRHDSKYNHGAELDFMAPITMQEMFINYCIPEGANLKSPDYSPLYSKRLADLNPIIFIGGECDALMPDMRTMHEECVILDMCSKLIELPGQIHNSSLLHHLMPDGEHPFIVAGRELANMIAIAKI